MVRSTWHRKLSSVAVFLACALTTWAIVVALAWLEERLSASLRTNPGRALVAQTAKALPSDDFAQLLQAQHFTGADCASAIAGMDAAELLATMWALPPDFWRTQPNAGIFIRQAARSLSNSQAPATVLAELRSVLRSEALPAERCRRLLTAALAGILEAREIKQDDLITILQKEQEPDALAFLEVWLDFQTSTTPKQDLATARQIMAVISPDGGSELERSLTMLVVRLWAHRAPPVADALIFAKSYEQENNVHLLTAGARVLRMSNPDELHRRLIQFAPVMAREAGSIAAERVFVGTMCSRWRTRCPKRIAQGSWRAICRPSGMTTRGKQRNSQS